MKVLHILNEIKFSGAESMLKDAAPLFREGAIESHVLSTGDVEGEYANVLRAAGYAVHHIPFRKAPVYFLQLYCFLVREQFDVVHIHPERAFFWHALVAKVAKIKVVLRTVHNVFLFSGFLRLGRTVQRWIARQILGVKFVAVGPSVAQVERDVFRNNAVLIPNWVDTDKFSPATDYERSELRAKLEILPTDVVITSVGSCSEVKNHMAIIVAIAEVAQEFSNLIYLHVGEGPLLSAEIDLLKQNSLLEKARVLGQIGNVRNVLVASDIFVMTSKYEGVPLAGIEAMSCGLPVVVYDVYGLRDIVENGRDGFLVQPDPDALSDALKELVRNNELRERMGARAKNSVLRNFNMDDSLEKLVRLYRGEPTTLGMQGKVTVSRNQ
ncbi:MAG: hypothetical protein C0401_11085 [Anaerolinea sp.]|nr:hypothetical protein [Anaerolinea sp.]